MPILGIDHVQLAIPPGGEAAARRFWGEVMGLRELPKPPSLAVRGGLWFEGGIHLGIEPEMRPSVKMHPALVVADLEATRLRLVAAGAPWREGEPLPGMRRGHTQDPFGNRIELIERTG